MELFDFEPDTAGAAANDTGRLALSMEEKPELLLGLALTSFAASELDDTATLGEAFRKVGFCNKSNKYVKTSTIIDGLAKVESHRDTGTDTERLTLE